MTQADFINYEVRDLNYVVIHKEMRYAVAAFIDEEEAEKYIKQSCLGDYYEIVDLFRLP